MYKCTLRIQQRDLNQTHLLIPYFHSHSHIASRFHILSVSMDKTKYFYVHLISYLSMYAREENLDTLHLPNFYVQDSKTSPRAHIVTIIMSKSYFILTHIYVFPVHDSIPQCQSAAYSTDPIGTLLLKKKTIRADKRLFYESL